MFDFSAAVSSFSNIDFSVEMIRRVAMAAGWW